MKTEFFFEKILASTIWCKRNCEIATEYGIIFDTITNDTIIANEFLLLDTILTGID